MGMSECEVPDCNRPVRAKGLCQSHYNTARMKALRAEVRASVRECRQCGAEFSGKSPRAIFCSYKCKERFHAERGAEEARLRRIGRTCLQCGQTFDPASAKAFCCSKACSVAWQNAKRQADRRAEWEQRVQPCAHCGGEVPVEGRAGRRYCSPECKKRAMDARWRERAPDYMRGYLYGMKPGEFDALLAAQEGRCAICRTDEPGGRGTWHVDHCHDTKVIRGLLCNSCNSGLGRFKDNPAVLRAAADYLDRFT